jgi:hypothetical protein
MMKAVIQQESTGCAIASAAAIAGVSYRRARTLANSLGIHAQDPRLWSETDYMRTLLEALGCAAGRSERPFKGWKYLPDRALLAIKWHLQQGKPYWHWVVFVREGGREYVLDSKKSLKNNIRTDFGRMRPRWYIEVSSSA